MLTLAALPQIPGLPQLHDRHVPAEPAGVPDLHGVSPQPGRRRLRHHAVGLPPVGRGGIGLAPWRWQRGRRGSEPRLSAGSTPSWSSGASSTTRWTPRAGPPPWAPHPPPTSTSWPIHPRGWCRCSPRRPRWVHGGGRSSPSRVPPLPSPGPRGGRARGGVGGWGDRTASIRASGPAERRRRQDGPQEQRDRRPRHRDGEGEAGAGRRLLGVRPPAAG